jgi:hypothetical protein
MLNNIFTAAMARVRRFVILMVPLVMLDGVAASFLPQSQPLLSSSVAEARFRGGRGGGRAGGYRVAARPTVRPGSGAYRSRTIANGRYHRPAQSPYYGYRPGVRPGYTPGHVRRVARRTTRRVAYRTMSGYTYYYGTPVTYPESSCSTVYWEGMTAYNCGGVMYVYEGGQYFPITG